ncbi:MAG TPA: LysR family transcriptional regulator [Caldimonas sp.]|jgi:DNA-binding transcriptional LysR family regulator|nr:LysR family transcriptional regulator [Caldimonas sp.]HEX2541600.1 LysR family transcriptional regulator [Caldimonas sp.]
MKLEFLATLDAILRRGSFAAAADDVGLTPAAVSLQVKRLEEHFGQPLFVRSARVAQPTPIAHELVRTMREALLAMDALRVRSTPLVEGRMVIGTIRTVQTSILPAALLEVHRRYPKLFVRALQGESGLLMQHLKTGVLDAAVVVRPSTGGAGRFHWVSLTREPFVLIAPPHSRGDSLTELLRTHDWIQFDTTLVSGRMAARYLHRLAPRARGTVEVDSIDTVHALVSAGRGISVVPKRTHLISKVLPVREIALDQGAHEREIAFVCRAMDKDNRRVLALQEAFALAYEQVDA